MTSGSSKRAGGIRVAGDAGRQRTGDRAGAAAGDETALRLHEVGVRELARNHREDLGGQARVIARRRPGVVQQHAALGVEDVDGPALQGLAPDAADRAAEPVTVQVLASGQRHVEEPVVLERGRGGHVLRRRVRDGDEDLEGLAGPDEVGADHELRLQVAVRGRVGLGRELARASPRGTGLQDARKRRDPGRGVAHVIPLRREAIAMVQ